MFKKKPTIKPLAPLRNSDRRKLADQIVSEFGLETDNSSPESQQTAEENAEATAARASLRNSLLPGNTQAARFTTTRGPDLKQASGTIYVGAQEGEESKILWFQVDGRIIPSVYTLWRNPDMVPLLHTPDIVIKKLQGGADLMIPGLAGGPPFPPGAKKGSIVAIAGTDKPSVPLAVGVCEVDVGTLGEVRGAKGHAVQNMHWVGDELWAYSAANRPGQQPPEEIEGWSKVLEERGLVEKAQDLLLDSQEDGGGVSLADQPTNGDVQAEASQAPGSTNALAEVVEAKELNQHEIDEAFRNAFLYGVHHFKTTNPDAKNHGLVFPLQQSVVMATMVQPFLPAYSPEQAQQLQIKKTSWKNVKKFIKSLDKEKIIKSKDRDGNEVVVQDIDFNDAAVLDFKPYRLPKKDTAGGASLGRSEVAHDKIDAGDDSVGQKLQVITSYRPTPQLQAIFDAARATQALYTPPEVRALVTSYIERERLVSDTNKRLVRLDARLAGAVFDGSGPLDAEVLAKGAVPRDALVDRVLRGMATSYAIVRAGAGADPGAAPPPPPKTGVPPKIRVTLETRAGNKTVTKLSGLEPYHLNPRPLAEELRKTCAGRTSAEPLAGAAKKGEREVVEVMVQGPQTEAVIKALERRGVERRWVEVLDKTKGKKK